MINVGDRVQMDGKPGEGVVIDTFSDPWDPSRQMARVQWPGDEHDVPWQFGDRRAIKLPPTVTTCSVGSLAKVEAA